MLKQPLHVMVTRPLPAGEVLCQHVVAAGGRATLFPTIVFLPPIHPAPYTDMHHYDWWIFTSPQAVYASQLALQEPWQAAQRTIHIAAVGAGTAAALQAAGFSVTALPADTDWNSEGLLDLAELQHIRGKKIAIVTGTGGRTFLQEQLQARGAAVDPIYVYQRACPAVAVDTPVALLRAGEIDVIVCTSGDGLQNLTSLLSSAWSDLQGVALIVISERMRTLAVALGFTQIFMAKNASHNAIMETLTQLAARQAE
jgi:uroporphyrinogen-III synthase